MGDHARGCRLSIGATFSFIARGVTTEEAKRRAFTGVVKRCSKHEFTCHPNSWYDTPSTSQDTATISKMGPMIVEGPTNAQGSKVKLAS
jgi:hypothetical protein